ncbi:hypothetical protein ERO13_D06G123350v2 [Gossypium hirsutum]|nr:hypothetical protein ERO13_D06G123350v2 [Gossypium hirsutum]
MAEPMEISFSSGSLNLQSIRSCVLIFGYVCGIPFQAEWFSPVSVHRLERQVVPHFFSGKSPEHMPEKYMECRNHIVAKYMDNPLKRITVSDCQGLIDGISNEDLTRIVRFLDHWGIINYCAAAPSHEPWSAGSYLREEPNGDVHVPSSYLREGPTCSGAESKVDVLLCSDCFHDGRFVSGHSSIDFVRVDSTKDYGDLDGDTEHVGTKSKAQCILHFVRLPMEDGLLENLEVPSMPKSTIVANGDSQRLHSNMNGSLPGPSLQDADYQSKVPFENSGNPVMAMVAFLASAVGPRVAVACAHASLAALAEDVDKEGSGHGNRMNMESVHSREGGLHGSVHQKENSAIHSFGQNEAEDHPLSAEKVKAAAKAGLAAAAMKAKLFANHEEREIQRLSANIINHQVFFLSFSRVYLVMMWNFIWLIRELTSVKDLKPGQKRTCPVAFIAHLCYLA